MLPISQLYMKSAEAEKLAAAAPTPPASPTRLKPGSLSVSISDTQTWSASKRYTVYKLEIKTETATWHVFKRYTDFYHLYEKIRKHFPDMNIKMPAKKFIGNMNPQFIEHRKENLLQFIRTLLEHPILSHHPEVRVFLELDEVHDMVEEDDNKNDNSKTNNMNLGSSEQQSAKPSDFEFLKVIGQGSFGKVLLAQHKKSSELYAVKVLAKENILRRHEEKHIMSERNVLLQNISHPFLVGLHYSFQTPDKLYFVLDYVNGGELFFHLQKERSFSEERSRFYAAEMASAIGYLHSINIIYRDLKPENILLDSKGHIVLTDFGLCKEGIVGNDTTTTFCGTPEYLAPEVILKQPYDKAVDWWCLGAVTYEMLFKWPPFYSRDVNEMYHNILHKPPRIPASASPLVKDLLEALLQKDKTRRFGHRRDFDEIKDHAFFITIDWDLLYRREITPPYNPDVDGGMDLRHFDPEFTHIPVPGSVERSAPITMAANKQSDEAFVGFSYVPGEEDSYLSEHL